MTEDIDPVNPCPEGSYHVKADSTWYYVDDDLARTIAPGPATDTEPGDDWILSFTAAGVGPSSLSRCFADADLGYVSLLLSAEVPQA